MKLQIEATDTVKTMATDGKRLWVNPDFVCNRLKPAELVAVIAHEVEHCSLAHPARLLGRQSGRWQYAADLSINPRLDQADLELPDGALRPYQFDLVNFQTADWYYARLPETSEGAGIDWVAMEEGDADGPCGGVRIPVLSDGKTVDKAECARQQREWASSRVQAAKVARSRGTVPQWIIEELSPGSSQVTWRDVIRPYCLAACNEDYAWTRPSRRTASLGGEVVLPGRYSDTALGAFVILVDCSSSMGQDELNAVAGECQAIGELARAHVLIVYHTTKVTRVDEWEPNTGPLIIKRWGHGGTDHCEAFEVAAQRLPDACVIIACTDLDTRLPPRKPRAPVLWLVPPGVCPDTPPWGRVITMGERSQ